ncbi:type III secretion system (T3SS) SseB-like protein [Herbihabitans rhizosphaerae]|uniref:Type III secretion system (T3SS) SseB-like protein n=1 Tax=Herbihabitans rhizosphaerae TaxID=1872711 RepID=A0A4V2EU82_9PSEU|nr:SAV_915 family protein [Herbihabitans rhizosphaerae]RZS43663.1 type III secretion system (T3SS) SseB-like protein [Herbihabitans rhizosphaerae]
MSGLFLERRESLPPMVFVPCVSTILTGGGFVLDTHELPDGRRALPVYSTLGRLAASHGETHPWIVVAIERLTPDDDPRFDALVLDPEIPAANRLTA